MNVLIVATTLVLAVQAVPIHNAPLEKQASLKTRREISDAQIRALMDVLKKQQRGSEASNNIEHMVPEREFLLDVLKSHEAKTKTETKREPRRCLGGIWMCTNDEGKGKKKEQSSGDDTKLRAPEIKLLIEAIKARNAKRLAERTAERSASRKRQYGSRRRCLGGIWLCQNAGDDQKDKPEQKQDDSKSGDDCRPGFWFCNDKRNQINKPPQEKNPFINRLRSLDRSQVDRLKMNPPTKIDDDGDWISKILTDR